MRLKRLEEQWGAFLAEATIEQNGRVLSVSMPPSFFPSLFRKGGGWGHVFGNKVPDGHLNVLLAYIGGGTFSAKEGLQRIPRLDQETLMAMGVLDLGSIVSLLLLRIAGKNSRQARKDIFNLLHMPENSAVFGEKQKTPQLITCSQLPNGTWATVRVSFALGADPVIHLGEISFLPNPKDIPSSLEQPGTLVHG